MTTLTLIRWSLARAVDFVEQKAKLMLISVRSVERK